MSTSLSAYKVTSFEKNDIVLVTEEKPCMQKEKGKCQKFKWLVGIVEVEFYMVKMDNPGYWIIALK